MTVCSQWILPWQCNSVVVDYWFGAWRLPALVAYPIRAISACQFCPSLCLIQSAWHMSTKILLICNMAVHGTWTSELNANRTLCIAMKACWRESAWAWAQEQRAAEHMVWGRASFWIDVVSWHLQESRKDNARQTDIQRTVSLDGHGELLLGVDAAMRMVDNCVWVDNCVCQYRAVEIASCICNK